MNNHVSIFSAQYIKGVIMKEFKIKLDTVEKVKSFVNITSTYPFEIDICSNRYVIDAKSIMGIFSLDISKELIIKAYSDDTEDFEKDIKDFLI